MRPGLASVPVAQLTRAEGAACDWDGLGVVRVQQVGAAVVGEEDLSRVEGCVRVGGCVIADQSDRKVSAWLDSISM